MRLYTAVTVAPMLLVGHSRLPDFLLEWKIVGPRTLLHQKLPMYSNGCSQLPGIESVEKRWKQSLLAYSIEMDPADLQEPEDLYFRPSLGQFQHSVCRLCSLNRHYITSEAVAASNVFKWTQLTPRH